MTIKKGKKSILAVLLALAMAFMLAACGEAGEAAEQAAEQATEAAEQQQEESAAQEETVKAVKTITDIDTEGMEDIPLQIESIEILDDGSVRIVPTEDLLKNAETNDELKDGAIYPFADSGKAKDVFLVRYGNGGYRTIICLMDDGSLSALSAKELIEDHITVVWDNLTGRDTYTSVKEVENGDSFSVVGITEDDEEIELDFSLDF